MSKLQIFVILFFYGLLFSCSRNAEEPKGDCGLPPADRTTMFRLDSFPQKWKLVETYGGMIAGRQSTKGDSMHVQEYYLFNTDSTFFRSRTELGGNVVEMRGTFKVDRGYFNLIYSEPLGFFQCSQDSLNEMLEIVSSAELRNSGCVPLDGLGFIYRRIQ
ncbi:MAG TPA: hypothetical protein VF691_22765 [Cytophagaceae bacterium]|jgi:hypothetical protein